ncbi:MAG: RIP metalloprotease RseP [Verrucomicrobiales bacterium]|nr:RIP metalloprotease RseP [Verrucomicrobiales bacterium]
MDWFDSLGAFGAVLKVIILIIEVVMVFNLMILVHEWGHFLAARWRGLHVDRFQIWFGKPIWKKTINGVQYGLGCIPAGGFVSLPQMAPMESIEGEVVTDEPLPPIKPIDKIIVAFAGPLFSFLLAAFFAVLVSWLGKPESDAVTTTTIGYVLPDSAGAKAGLQAGDRILEIDGNPVKRFQGLVDSVSWAVIASEGEDIVFKVERPEAGTMEIKVPAQTARVESKPLPWWRSIFQRPQLKEVGITGREAAVVGSVQENGPAAEAGMQAGDKVVSVDGRTIYNPLEVMDMIKKKGDQPLVIEVDREGKKVKLEMQARLPDQRPADFDRKLVGIVWQGDAEQTLVHPSVGQQLSLASRSMYNMISALVSAKSDISASHMSGPLGIGRVYFSLFQRPYALQWVLWFSVILNVNLAIMNLLPFPVLDGGHITLALGEAVRGRPLQGRFLEVVQTACVLLLFGFLIFVSVKDVGDWFGGSKDKGKAEEIRWLSPEERSAAAAEKR